MNPPDVDEFITEARITGIPGIYRESRIHALNQKEIANSLCEKNQKTISRFKFNYLSYWWGELVLLLIVKEK